MAEKKNSFNLIVLLGIVALISIITIIGVFEFSNDNLVGEGIRTTVPSAISVQSEKEMPNIVFILFDDLGYGDFSTYMKEYKTPIITTPNIDKVAEDGIKLTQYYTQTVCCPTRVSLLTGNYPANYGITIQLSASQSYRGVSGEETTLAQTLKDEGYHTAEYGKWHIGRNKPEFLPDAKGYEEFSIFVKDPSQEIDPFEYRYPNPFFLTQDGEIIHTQGHSTEIITDMAIDFIDRNKNEAWFVKLDFWAPHRPFVNGASGTTESWDYRAPEEWREKYEPLQANENGYPRNYAGIISHADNEIGRLLAHIEDLGLAENTLIIITSDNGGINNFFNNLQNEENRHLQNGPFRGWKGEHFEGGIRVPMVMKWPGHITPGSESNEVVISNDIFPTIADMFDISLSKIVLDGKSVAPIILNGKSQQASDLFWEYGPVPEPYISGRQIDYDYAVRRGDWKLVVMLNRDDGTSKDIHLFNVVDDPYEQNNLAHDKEDKVEMLEALYRNWRYETPKIWPIDKDKLEESYEGGVSENDDRYIFTTPGVVKLPFQTLYDFHDGDFTFVLEIIPDNIGEAQRIATKLGTWALTILPDGRLRLRINSESQEESYLVLESEKKLLAKDKYQIAFTVMQGPKGDANIVRLYIDGEIEAEDYETINDVKLSDHTITLGSRKDTFEDSFIGKMERVQLFVTSLTSSEIQGLKR